MKKGGKDQGAKRIGRQSGGVESGSRGSKRELEERIEESWSGETEKGVEEESGRE